MSDFAPGIASMRQAGIPVTVAPYASGPGGIRQSLDAMALKMREGRIDARVIGHVGKVLAAAGLDGRSGSTTDAKRVAALLDDLRATTVYAPDAYGAEVIQSASGTMCLSPDLCLKRGDCDDLSVALGSMTLSLGIPTQIVKQNFGPEQQEHVLIAVYVDGDWRYADPSTNMPFGKALQAVEEVWVDPMDPIGNVPEASPQIVTLGRPSIGVGTWLGYPTVQDLIDLTNAAAYNLQQLQVARAACPGGFTDRAEWAAWQTDFQNLVNYLNEAVKVTNAVTSTAHWPTVATVDLGTWDLMRHAIDLEIDLDRRWRQFGGNCAAPVYPNEPQPTSDPDLWALQASDTALKNVKAVLDGATKPLVIGVAGVGVGIIVALAAVVAIDHLLPSRR